MARDIFSILREKTMEEEKPGALFGTAEGAACKPKLFQPDPEWKPKNSERRVEIMVSVAPHRLETVRSAVNNLQEHLLTGSNKGKLEARVTAFLDDCIHSTDFSKKLHDVGSGTTRWHCFQGRTRFADALANSNRDDMIDAIVIYGDKFDDKIEAVMQQADKLKKQGTRIFALALPYADKKVTEAYQQVAEHTGGMFLQLTDQRSIDQIVPIISDFLFKSSEELLALPMPDTPDTKAFLQGLKRIGCEPGEK